MAPATWLGGTAALTGVVAGPPLLALLVLWVAGELAGGPAFAAAAVVLAAAAALAGLVARDLARLAAALARPAQPGAPAADEPALPALATLARQAERMARAVAERAGALGEALRANETIIERLPDPLLLLDGEAGVLRANAAARTAFGADIPAVLRHPQLREAVGRARREGAAGTTDLLLPVPVPREVQATVIPLEPALPDGARVLLVLSDRSRERAVERMRVDFVANASHELRTPLASLIGFIETLRGPAADDPQAQRRFLAIMAEQAARMHRLIDDLLSLSRVELGEHAAPAEPVDLATVLHRVLAGFEPRLAGRGTHLALEVAAGLPPAPADADQIAQVIANLVDNAMKYGRPDGRIAIALQPAPADGRFPSGPGAVLSVRDDGPGIPRAHVPRLTERFYRVDKGRSRSAGGTGLGLAIVKHIVNRHRGRLVIDGGEGRGAAFHVWLPLAADSHAATPPGASP